MHMYVPHKGEPLRMKPFYVRGIPSHICLLCNVFNRYFPCYKVN